MPDNSAQLNSPSYLLPVEDTEFLLRDELRGVRFGLEYEKAELGLRDWGVRSTIIVFGSARAPSPERAQIIRSEETLTPEQDARLERQLGYYEAARTFGRIASERGGALAPRGIGATTSSPPAAALA